MPDGCGYANIVLPDSGAVPAQSNNYGGHSYCYVDNDGVCPENETMAMMNGISRAYMNS